ncbi:MAG: hypothetical protein QG657_5655 [Acidobacteriota bacterium]|nr:hypothetical protein [Acidobacteriota bacterium]
MAGIWADLLGMDKGSINKEDNFFELGGHSLKATTMMTLIHKEFNVRLKLIDIFKTPTIRELAALIGRVAKESFSRITPVEKKEHYVLSSAQKRMYILQQMDIKGIGYNMSRGMVLEGDVDMERLESAVKNLIERHDAFRTSFHMTNNDVVQVIHDNVAFEIEKNLVSPGEGYIKEFIRPFDLSHAPLLRIGLVKIAGKRYLLIIDMHHIISDGISIEILVHEFTTLYLGEKLPSINLQYKDYAEWQNRLKQEENLLMQKAYWRKEFEGEIPVLELPTDYSRPAVQSFEGDTAAFSVRREIVESLHLFALETGTTLYMVLMALYNILLAKLGAQEEIIIGTPIGGRRNADLEKVIGVFVNTLPLRNYPVGERIFANFLEEVKEKTLEIFENQEYQYDDLVEQLALKRDTGRNPLFDAMFVLQNMGSGEIEIPGLQIASFDLETTTSKFDLTLTGVEIEGKLNFSFEYCTKLFKPATIERFINYFKNIILGILQDKCKRLADLEIITQEEKNQVLYDFNNTEAGFPADKTIQQLFEEQAEQTPDHIAILGHGLIVTTRIDTDIKVGAGSQTCPMALTYRQLNEQSNQLAVLLTEKGVLPDSIVGIMADRSVEMIIGIIGILKSGRAYMPIDPDYPEDRINYMLKDSGARFLIGMEEYQKKIIVNCKREALRSHSQEQAPHHHSSFIIHHSNQLAYIIYTSGTTGQPKGSLIEHRNVVRLLFNDKFQFDFTGRDVWTLFHSFCFDFSVWEMYGALLYGGKLVIMPKIVTRDTSEFLGLLVREAVTVLNQTPSAFYNLVNEVLNPHWQGAKLYINYVIFGGEALNPSKLKDWREKYPQTRLINMFGITETTVHVTYKEISGKDIELNISGIGKPIPTIRTYILDKYLNPVPLGVAGEICIGGDGVGRGYLNRVELTEGKFIENPFKTGDRLYRSGDMGRFLENGEMEYSGRIDQQVKIRGFRIELAEIENRLLEYDGIKEAVILVEETATDKYLCAYIVSLKEITLMELRTHLAGKLPDYMIPSYFVRLGQIPLTPNGKIDKKAFPRIHGNAELLAESAPPVTETEEKLVELWANTLGIRAGINIDFFLSGGDSIKAVRLVNLINTKFSTNLKIADIYLNGTIRSLASLIDRDKTAYEYTKYQLNGVAIELEQLKNTVMMNLRFPEEIEDIYPMSDIQRGMVFHSLKDIGAAMYHDQMVYQATIKDFIPEIFINAFNLLVEKHSILRTVFHFESYEESVQVVYRKVHSNIEHNDISHMGKGEQENHLLRLLEEDKNQPFRFDIPPLWRLRTFDLGNDSICVVMVAHHAILDGWSVASLATELLNTYWKLKSNPSFHPGILKNSYKAFIIEQVLEKKRGDAANFWKYELEGYKRLELPNGFQIKNSGNIVRKYRSKLGDELFFKLKATAKAHHSTVKNLCFSAYIYMMNMLSYEDEIVAGLVTNNRPVCEDGDKILGCFLNTIPVRILIPGCISWLEYTKQVDRKLLQLKKYERVPLFEIVKIIGENTQNRNPIFDVIFNFIDFHVVEQIEQDYEKNDSTKLHIEENITTNTAFDFSISTTLGDFELLISYSDSFFDEMTVKNMCFYFERVLNKFITDPGSIISKIELIPVDERHRLLYEFNDTEEPYPKNKVIHELFTEQVEKTPDRIVIIGSTISSPPMYLQMTYCQLNGQSNRLANILIEKGVAPDAIVGMMVERSIEMVIGIMGILKSGGAYLPIDPGYPQKRIDYMLKDSGAKLFVTTSDQEGEKVGRWESEKVLLEEIPKCSYPLTLLPSYLQNSSNLAYIIYTSGSTGKPKGVIVEHASVVNLLYAMQNKYPLEVSDAYLLKTPYVFDVSVTELFGWFLGGGRVVILEKEGHRDPRIIAEWIERYIVTHLNFVPSMFKVFVDYVSGNIKTPLSSLKYIFLAGEVMLPELAERFRNLNTTVNLENIYGPTESTVYSSKYSLSDWKSTGAVPIGKPLPNMKLYILSNHANIQPIGAVGELYIGGSGLARGYINRPEMTYQTFHLQHPAPPSRETINKDFYPLPPNIYKTGDLARWLADGNIEFLGRIDLQVKIRGFRIELGEIESRLLNYPGIKEAVVLTREKENKYLCAYIVSNGELVIPGLQDYLAKELPVYMVPSYFVRMEKIPVTSNGKVDWKALPPVDTKTAGATVEYAAPRNNIEKKLVEIWSEVLVGDSNRKLGIDDNFFELGGNSLDIFKVSNRIKQQLEKEIPVTVIFRYPTVRALAAYLDQGTSDSTANNKKIFEVIDKGKNKLKKRMEKRKVKNQ